MINDKITIYKREIENRVVMQPMEGCDGTLEGGISDLTYRRYMRFAKSGAGIIWFEAVAVSNECRANPRQLFLNEKTKESFAKLLKDVKAESKRLFGFEPVIIMQTTNSGRWSKPNGKPEPIVAYRNELWEIGKEDQPYTIASDEYCDGIIKKYGVSTLLAKEVGFDGIDIKCCHGYLFNEFLSAKNREGKYGGSFENRTRLYFSCIDEVKKNLGPNMFFTTRLNACDGFKYPYGYGVNEKNEVDLTETKMIVKILEEKGIELINVSLGNPYLIPHVNRPCKNDVESIQDGLDRIYYVTKELQSSFENINFVVSGVSVLGADCVDYADKLLKENVGRLAGFGRMIFAYPTFYADYLKDGKLDKNKCCLACGKCTELMRHASVTGCPVRDQEVYLPLYKKYVLGRE